VRRILGVLRVVAVVGLAVAWWRANRRFGTAFVNRVVNPALLQRRWAGAARSEIGTLEHVGRRSGTRRLTPVHPEPASSGFRIIVPLGAESQWARNVLAAGRCRLQLHEAVYELDEPRLIAPEEVEGLPRPVRLMESFLGFRYLVLRTFASRPGGLEDEPTMAKEPEKERATASPDTAARPGGLRSGGSALLRGGRAPRRAAPPRDPSCRRRRPERDPRPAAE
jgi:deazaflavin-dependent oxidoreductase (nitroreductase family)